MSETRPTDKFNATACSNVVNTPRPELDAGL
jgi:hypothetical protein